MTDTLSKYQQGYAALAATKIQPLTIGLNLATLNDDGSVSITFNSSSQDDISRLRDWLIALVPPT